MVAAYVRGTDEKTRMQRRNIVRYCVLSQALVFRDISMRVRKRFPTMDTLVAAGFMMQHEKEKYDEIQYRYAKYWMPFQWALAVCQEARNQQKIASDILLQKIGEEIKLFRTNMAILCNFDWVPLPIMYPQLIVLAVHTYFLICVLSRQFIISDGAANKSRMDIFFPLMTVLQFIFYMGWLKVAEAMLNPFGEDDDDFECNFLLDKNLTIGLTVVDEGYGETPALKKDIFWNDKIEPLYTLESAHDEQPMCGITGSANVKIAENNREIKMLPLPHDTDPGHTSHPFGLFRRSFQKRFGSKSTAGAENHFGSNVLKSIKQQFPRSLSYSQVHFVTSLSSDDSEESVKPQNDMTMRTLGRTTSHPNYRRSSLTSALEAIVNDSSAYTNLGVIIGDESAAPTKEPTFSFPSRHEFHARGSHGTANLSPNVTSHRLEDVEEECEESASVSNSVVKQEDHAKPSVMTILNSMDPKQNAQVDSTSRSTIPEPSRLNVEESSQDMP
uniref:Bestrophin homolog n=2 Tax=Parascaris univalens TaxID=6257 RepID=A0A915AEN0_PARUN